MVGSDEEDGLMTIDSAESGRRLRCALFVDFDNAAPFRVRLQNAGGQLGHRQVARKG